MQQAIKFAIRSKYNINISRAYSRSFKTNIYLYNYKLYNGNIVWLIKPFENSLAGRQRLPRFPHKCMSAQGSDIIKMFGQRSPHGTLINIDDVAAWNTGKIINIKMDLFLLLLLLTNTFKGIR